jgi:2-iminoacetate synthase
MILMNEIETQKADYISDSEINFFLEIGREKSKDKAYIREIIERAGNAKGLGIAEVAALLNVEDDYLLEEMYDVFKEIKQKIYGNRIVMFAPLYISDHCVNDCVYCGYKCSNKENPNRKTQN